MPAMKTHEPAWRTGLRAWSASRRLLVSATLGGGVAAACRVVGSPWVESLLVGWCSFALLSLLLSGLTLGLHGDIPRPDEVARNDQSSTAMLMGFRALVKTSAQIEHIATQTQDPVPAELGQQLLRETDLTQKAIRDFELRQAA